MKTAESSVAEAIAIVGMACRLPGAADVDALWQAVVSKRDCVAEFPGGRTTELDAYYAQPGVANFAPTRRGGFLPDPEMFDAGFFAISPREAEWTDPQQRMLLEVGWEAFEDAGMTREQLSGSKTGVFFGVWASEYEMHCGMHAEVMDFFHLAGGPLYGTSGRVAFQFDLRGPDISVNAACASSLVAVHLAVRSLRSGESSVALAGGVNLIFRHEITQALAAANVLSRDGRCRFGDASGQGFVRSEGVALLVLKRQSDAERDGDRILGLIRGTAVTNNGQETGSMATPSEVGQRQSMLDALADGQVDPATVGYVEAHGTGTRAGDPVELAAIASVFGRAAGRAGGQKLPVGSVKSNIGHTESAAGAAGILKAVQAMRHGFLPATIHVEELNPLVDWAENGLALQLDGAEWPRGLGQPRRASVNGLGLTGTNAHVVLEEAPARVVTGSAVGKETYLLPISAATAAALRLRAASMAARVGEAGNAGLADLCYTATVRRTHLAHRAVVVGGSAEELRERLLAFADGADAPGVVAGTGAVGKARKVAFVFPGQGSQWVGMGRELLKTEPVFLAAMEACDRAIAAETGWSLLEQLQNPALVDRLTRIDVIQPTLFAMEVALAELWRSWGVVPQAVVGHSMGEVAAARVAGILTLEDAAKIICRRSKLLMRVAGQGAMVVVDLPRAEAEQAIVGLEDRVSIAVSNSPRSTVLAGDPKALDGLVERLEDAEVFCRWVRVDVASHSPQMDPLKEDLSAALSDLEPRTGDVPLYSTVRSALLSGPELDTGYWVSNLRETVQFAAAIEALMAEGFDTFVEMSPHPILIPFVEQTAEHVGGAALAVGSLRREEAEAATLLLGLGRVFVAGGPVDWRGLYPAGNVVSLPAYPWQRERYWIEEGAGKAGFGVQAGHALAGEPLRVATGELVWTARLTAEAHPWLKDHAVEGSVLLPASAYAEIAHAVGLVVLDVPGGPTGVAVERLRLDQAITMGDDGAMHLQVVATPRTDGSFGIEFFSRDGERSEWSRAAAARLVSASPLQAEVASLADWEDAELSGEAVSGRSHAEGFARRGYEFGPNFCQIDWLALQSGHGLAAIRVPEALQGTKYQVHPATLDAALQLLGGMLLLDVGENETLLPVELERVEFTPERERSGVFYARARRAQGAALRGDVALYDAAGRLRARVTGLEFKPLTGAAEAADAGEQCLFSPGWERLAEVSVAKTAGAWLLIGDAGAVVAGLARELRERGAVVEVAGLEQVLDGRVRLADGLAGVVLLNLLEVQSLEQLQAGLLGAAGLVRLLTEAGDSGAGTTPRLWWLTCGAQALDGEGVASPLAAGVWGFAASVRNEHPELRASCMDVVELDMARAAAELLVDGNEDRVLLRGVDGEAMRYGARLTRFARATGAGGVGLAELEAKIADAQAGSAGGFVLVQREWGALDSFELRSVTRAEVGPGEVEIAVEVAALNFRDVLLATGNAFVASSPFLGGECSGTVVRVGAGVTELRPGDRVVAISASFEEMTLFGSRVVLPETLVVRIPETMSFAEAAGLPCVFLTVYCALVRVAHLGRGETILIHAAAGGVGLAAIQVAHWLGAEVYATVGSEEKREYVASLGVKHIMSSRTLDFQREIAEKTGGRGVDVVLNSLAGAAITAGLESLAPYGRFVEIGKRDIFEDSKMGLRPFKQNRSFVALDLAQYVVDRRATVGAMLREVMELFERGVFQPLPVTLLPVSQADEAFRTMATGRHIGKIVLSMRDPAARVRRDASGISAEASYLITGGLGGLGLVAAEALAARGARYLVLLGRRAAAAEAPAARAALNRLAGLGVQVVVKAVDIGSAAEVDALFCEIRATMPPLRGVIHAAGVLDDAVVGHLTAEKFRAVMAGKVGGALAMDGHFRAAELDFVVYYASAAGVLGTAGQANYAAANAVLDGLARQQRARGIPATSIDWGSWAEVGLAAQQANRGARLVSHGLRPLSPAEGTGLLFRILEEGPVQVAAMGFDAEGWCAANPAAGAAPFLAGLRTGAGTQAVSAGSAERCRQMSLEKLQEALIPWLQEQVAGVLRCGAERVLPDKPLRSLGLDSLTALELRNRLERGLQLKLSATLAWNYPTLMALAGHLVAKIGVAGDAQDAGLGKAASGRVAEKLTAESKAVPNPGKAPLVEAGSSGGLSAAELLEAELLSVESLLNS